MSKSIQALIVGLLFLIYSHDLTGIGAIIAAIVGFMWLLGGLVLATLDIINHRN